MLLELDLGAALDELCAADVFVTTLGGTRAEAAVLSDSTRDGELVMGAAASTAVRLSAIDGASCNSLEPSGVLCAGGVTDGEASVGRSP